jgi:hypothetical protein
MVRKIKIAIVGSAAAGKTQWLAAFRRAYDLTETRDMATLRIDGGAIELQFVNSAHPNLGEAHGVFVFCGNSRAIPREFPVGNSGEVRGDTVRIICDKARTLAPHATLVLCSNEELGARAPRGIPFCRTTAEPVWNPIACVLRWQLP